MKYSREELSAMAHRVLSARVDAQYRSIASVEKLRADQLIGFLTARFGCSETYVLNQLVRMADRSFNSNYVDPRNYTSNRA